MNNRVWPDASCCGTIDADLGTGTSQYEVVRQSDPSVAITNKMARGGVFERGHAPMLAAA